MCGYRLGECRVRCTGKQLDALADHGIWRPDGMNGLLDCCIYATSQLLSVMKWASRILGPPPSIHKKPSGNRAPDGIASLWPRPVRLACVLHGPRFPDDGDLHLPRVLHVLLDAVGYVARQENGAGVVHLLGLDDDAYLTAGLDGVAFLDTREAGGDALQPFEPLEVGLERLPTCARARCADGVGGLDDDRVEGLCLFEVDIGR